MAGDGEVQERLARLNDFMQTINAKSKTSADSLRHEAMAIEGKYNPEVQRNLEIEKAIALTAKYNLSAETQLAMLAEIEEKHRRIVDLIQQQSPEGQAAASLAKEQADAAKAAAAATAAADEEMLRSKAKAAKETERLQNEQLSNYEKYVAKVKDADELFNKGIVDSKGRDLRIQAAKQEYDDLRKAEADKATLAQNKIDAEKKAAADEKALWAARLQALDDSLEEERRLQAAAVSDAAIDATQRRARASIEATEAADREQNATRQRAINILNSLEDATQRYARVTDELRAHLDAGDITNEQYAQGLANIERRQRAMAGGANNAAYAIGNTVTGLEDFVTVLSITGFGMEGFSAATRAASNNVGQAVRSLGTAASAIAAPLVSIGMVLVGAAIPALYKWVTGANAAEDATRRWSREMEVAIRLAGELGRLEIRKLKFEDEVADIRSTDDSKALHDRYNDLAEKERLLLAEIQKTLKESEASAQVIFDNLVPTGTISDFNDYVNMIGEEFGGDVEEGFRIRFKNMQTDFIRNAVEKDAESARVELLRQMRAMQADMEALRPGSSSSNPFDRIGGMADMGLQGGAFNDFVNMFPEGINDAAVIDQIEALEGKIEELSREDSEAARVKKEELIETRDLLKEIHDQYLKALEAETAKNDEQARIEGILTQQQIDSELRSLEIQQKKASLLGEENEAERKLLDLALKREAMGRSGAIPDDVLDNLFNMELEAIAGELENQIAKAEEVIHSTAAMSEPQAYTSANRQIMEAAGKSADEKLQEQVDLLKAIRDHLAGTATLNVEVM
jgi:hypothetical protein